MKKALSIFIFVLVNLFLINHQYLYAQSADLRLQYKNNQNSSTSSEMRPYAILYNDGAGSVPLIEVTYRYWFTSEPPGQDVYVNDWSAIGQANMTSSFGTIGSTRYLEIGFTSGAGSLAGGGNTGEMQNRIHDDGWGTYNQTNDYSFNNSISNYTDYDKFTVYHNGSLVWGTPPAGTTEAEDMEVTVEPTTTTAGSLISPAPTVYLSDALGDPVAGVDVTVSLNQNGFVGGSTIIVETDEDGLAVFDNLTINDADTGYELIFDADAALVSNVNSDPFTVEASDPDEMVPTAQPGNTIAGSTVSPSPSVTITDEFGNPTPGVDVTISLNKNSFSSGTTTVATNASGVAVFSDLVITQAATAYVITFDADAVGIDNENSSSFNITAAAASNMTVSTQPTESVAGGVIAGPPAVLVTDTHGNPKSGVNVTVSEADGYIFDVGTLTRATNASGIATFNDLEIHSVGTDYQLTFDADAVGVDNVNSNQFDVVSSGGSMTVTTQPTNTVAGVNITPAPSITLVDGFDDPIEGVDVTVSLNQGSFASGTLTVATNASGVATFSNLKINTADTDYEITFDADMGGVANVFSNEFDVTAGVAASMSVTTAPGNTVAGSNLSGPPAVTIVDAFGNPVSGIDIAVTLNKNSFASGTTTVTSNSSGIASYSNLVITTAATAYQLTFNADAGGVSNKTSGNFNITAAAGATLEVMVQPANSTAGETMSPAPVVLIEDTYGNPKSGVNVTATLNKNIFTGGSTTIVSTASNGQAVFNNLRIGTADTDYEITFSAPSLSSDTSDPFDVVQPDPEFGTLRLQYKNNNPNVTTQEILPYMRLYNESGLDLNFDDITIRYWFASDPIDDPDASGTDIFEIYTLEMGEDESNVFGNFYDLEGEHYLEIGFTSDFILPIGLGGDGATQNLMPHSATTGTMDFRIRDDGWGDYDQSNDYSFDPAITNYTDYDKITVYYKGQLVWGTPPSGTTEAEDMEVTVEPTTTTAGSLISPAPTVYIEDAFGDPVFGVDVTVSLNKSGFTGGSTTVVATNGSGLAVFDNLTIDDVDSGYQLTFNADAPLVSNVNSASFEIEASDPEIMVVTAQPGNTIAGSTVSPSPSVTITDEFGNPTADVDVTISLNKNSFSSGTTTVSTNASGVAVFSDLVITQAATGYIITYDADAAGVDNENSSSFNITAATATNMSITTQPSESVAGGVIAGPPTVLVTDTHGNPKSGVNVTVSEADGYIFDAGTLTRATNASGIATFTGLEINTVGTDYQLTFDADAVGVGNVNSNTFDVVSSGGSMTVTTQPTNTVAGVNITPAPSITLVDGFDDPIEGVDVTVSLNQGSFASGTLTVATNASGVATFSNLKINTADTDYQITFDADMGGVANVFSNEFDVTAGIAASMSITTAPGNTVAGNNLSGPPAVTIVDAFGNPVSGIDIAVTLNKNSFASGTTTVTSNSSGIASYSNLVITTAATAYQLTFNADAGGVSNKTSGNFNITAAAGATLEVMVQPANSTAGETMLPAPVVLIEDTYGNPKSGVNVTATLNKNIFTGGSTTIVSTASNGQAVFNNLRIGTADTDYEITFSAPSLSSDTSDPFDVVQPDPEFGTLRLQYKNDNPNVTTESIEPFMRLYNESGLDLNLDDITIRYWFASKPIFDPDASGTDIFEIYSLEMSEDDSDVLGSFHDVEGEHYLEVGFSSDIILPIGLGGDGATPNLIPDAATTGTMDFRIRDDGWGDYDQSNDYSFDPSIINYTDYDKITVYYKGQLVWGTPPSGTTEAENMEISVEPTTTTAGSLISPAPTVYIEDAVGDPVFGVEVTVSLNKSGFAGGSTTIVATNGSGLAVFDNLTINDADTGYQLTFSADAPLVSNVNSATIDVETDVPFEMVPTAQPGNTIAGSTVTPSPSVTITDEFGNPTADVDVTISLNKNSFSSGTTTVATNASGVAVFSDLVITQAATGYIITYDADAAGVDNINSSSFNITSAAATNMTISTQPTESVAGGVITGPPAVLVTDTHGNPKSGVDVTVSEADGYIFDAGTLTRATNASGIATFNDLEIHTVGSDYQLTFDADAAGVSNDMSDLFDVVSSGGSMTVTTQPTNTVAGVNITPAPSITLVDGFDDPIEGVDVTVSLNQGSFASGTLTVATNASGVATFSNLKINTADTDYQITFDADMGGVANVFSSEFDVTAGIAASMSITTAPGNTVAGNNLSGPPAVTIVDAYGNPVSGIDIAVTVNKNSFASGTTTVTSNSSGIASYSNLVITTAATAYQLTFNADAGGVSNITSGNFNITAAVATTLELITPPTNSTAEVTMSPAPVVIVEDTYGNPKSGINVTASLNQNSFMAGSTTIVSTASNGQAVFNNLRIGTADTDYEITFSAPSLSSDTSDPFDVVQPNPPFGSIRLQYENDVTNVTTDQIRPFINIINDSDLDINISDLTVRYWFTSEPLGTDVHATEYLEMGGSSNVTGLFDTNGDEYYLQLSFSPSIVIPIGLGGDGSTSNLMPSGASTGTIQHRIYSSPSGDYDQSDDYSFDPTITTFTDYPYINVYYKGQLVWGEAPPNPQTFYSRQSGDWDSASSWSNESHIGTSSTLYPNTFDTVIIGDGHNITLTDDVVNDVSVTVNDTGTLTTGTNILSGDGSFTLENGGTIRIGSPDGISSSGATGNIQTASRTFNTGANYRYVGSAAQITGSGLPSTVNNLRINNNSGVTSASDIIVSGILELDAGVFEMGSGTSLVTQNIDASGSGSVEMNLEIDGDFGYRMITSPVSTTYGDLFDNFVTQGFTGSDFPSRQPNIMWFMETYAGDAETENQSWRTIPGLGSSVVGGLGYFLYVFGDIDGDPDYDTPLPRTMSASGIEFGFNDPGDTFEFDVTYTSPSLESATHSLGWNLVGNPTMATIDWDHEDWVRSNIDETFYIWDPAANSGEGDYLVWNGVAGNNPNEGLISPFQSFWVKSNDDPEMSITHDVKTINGNYIGNQSKVESDEQTSIVKLSLTGGGLNGDTFLTFSAEGELGIDNYDAYLLESLNTASKLNFFSSIQSDDNPPFVINNLPLDFDGKLNIPLQVGGIRNEVSISDNFTLNWNLPGNWPSDWSIVLMDHVEKKAIPMHNQTSYSFWHDTPKMGMAKTPSSSNITNSRDKFNLPEMVVSNQIATLFDETKIQTKSNSNSNLITSSTSTRFTITIEKGVNPDIVEYLPDEPELKNNYPNPFNSSTNILFSIPNQEHVILDVYDMLGRKVGSLVNETLQPGSHNAIWNPGNLASGVYYCRLQIGSSILTSKMTLVK